MGWEFTAGRLIRTVLTLGGVAVATVLALKVLALVLEPRVTFLPVRALPLTPDDHSLPYEDVSVRTSDGVTIHGWFIPASRVDTAVVPLTLLFFHGNAENIGHNLDLARLTHAAGYNLLLIDYRGYGRSEGSPSEQGIYRDGEAALRYLRGRDDVDGTAIVLWGRSIGASVAVHLAATGTAGAHAAGTGASGGADRVTGGPAGLILESGFTSALELLREGSAWPLYPLAHLGTYRFDQMTRIRSVTAPLLVVHGTDDEIVPYRLGRRLYEAAPGRKQFLDIPGGGHNDLMALHSGELWSGVSGFLKGLR